ncbi:Uncharacterized protein FWK35_00007498 [Aphis craccivora]|uniref:Integrase catalytic domain-containing protein n=1 Tax=Aphis craccivora TaxID=307492 RepID=A0A6G0YMW2_APHCR|nr:Uncharacterized protein FWK35_00007498 [Aphis craccivora]
MNFLSASFFRSSNVNLTFFDGSTSEPTGKFKALVEYKDKVVETEFIVIKSVRNVMPLFGRDLMKAFNITWSQTNFVKDDYESNWPHIITDDIKPFYNRKLELHVEDKVLFWGYRVVIPKKFTKLLLTELHSTHLIYTSFQKRISTPDLRNKTGFVRGRPVCSILERGIARSYFWWLNIDKDIELIAKSCDIGIMHESEPLKVFARFGLPDTIVTGNGTPFTSTEFSDFCQLNADNKNISIQSALCKYLFFYRNTTHISTNQTPTKIMFRRDVKLLKKILEEVFIRDYIKPNQRGWKVCSIVEIVVDQFICAKIKLMIVGNFYNEVCNESLNETFDDGDSNNVKDKVTDSNKETYHSKTPEPCSTRIKRKCILSAREVMLYM